MRFRGITITALSFSAVDAGLWGLCAGSLQALALPVEVAAAGLAGGIAAMCWLTRWNAGHDQQRAQLLRNQELLIRTLADAVPAPPLAKTIPMPRAL